MPPQFRRILFASDLSENSRHAYQYVLSIAAKCNANVLLLHVIERVPAGLQQQLDRLVGEGTVEFFRKSREREAKDVLISKRKEYLAVNAALAEFYSDNGPNGPGFSETCQVLIEEGTAPEEIVSVQQREQCDLIVVGAHRGLFGGTPVGSVARKVLRHARIPVMIVPPSGQD